MVTEQSRTTTVATEAEGRDDSGGSAKDGGQGSGGQNEIDLLLNVEWSFLDGWRQNSPAYFDSLCLFGTCGWPSCFACTFKMGM